MSDIFQRPTLKSAGPQNPVLARPIGRGFQASPINEGDAPQMNVRAFAAADLAMGDIGKGISSVGGHMEKVSLMMSEAINTRRINEAQIAMDTAKQDIAAEIAKTPNTPHLWEGIAEKRVAETQKLLVNQDDSPYVKEQIGMASSRWGTHAIGETKMARVGQEFQLTAQTLGGVYNTAISKQNWAGAAAALNSSKPYLTPDKIAAMEVGLRNEQKQFGLKQIDDSSRAAVLTGGDLETGLKIIDSVPSSLMTDDEKDIRKFQLTDLSRRAKEIAASEVYKDTYSGLLRRISNHETILPAEVDGLMDKGSLDVPRGTSLKASLESKIPSPAGAFETFIAKEVMQYDGSTDPTQAKQEALIRKMVEMRPDSIQANRFSNVLEQTIARSKTQGGRVTSHQLAWAIDNFAELQKSGAFGQHTTEKRSITNAYMAMGDQAKMKAMGLDDDQARKLWETKGPARVDLYKKYTNAKDWEVNTELYNQQSAFTQELLMKARGGETALTEKVTDPAIMSASQQKSAEMQDIFEEWHASFVHTSKRLPSSQEISKKMNEMVAPYKDGGFYDGPSKDIYDDAPEAPKGPVIDHAAGSLDPNRYRVTTDGQFVGKASSYGYEGDDDNGNNSIGMKRGEQPWFGIHPTVALAPTTMGELGISLPKKKDGEWDLSSSLIDVTVNGKTFTAIVDETGMFKNEVSKTKLVDFTPEASAAAGIPTKQDVSNVQIKKHTP
ncbi:hypothetical protein UFOVP1329_11 [uncultured Caudovirales phage]|uniref:Uncharacterized protein n=1 Tax=uncultured Caudovirales phage TaxID=2100421 RepID=A0A6J5QZI1_9CAUD|nr:hypothetical protein UFOVP1150_36 [uncultured Caudovirales phage]CAB4198971.1 hypothetical protein UFOVP1329_11 [uncultured Caudovirales phage]CAB4218576.1 hypothetical protein UFOVP1595_25 [uncultured Caudovirales phage]